MIPGIRCVRDVLNGGPLIKNRAAMLPGKRVGTADEVAQVILMLMTNDYITHVVVHVDTGGRSV